MRRLLGPLILSVVAPFSAWTGTRTVAAGPDAPFTPRRVKGEPVNGMRWDIELAEAFSTWDEVELRLGLINCTGRKVEFDSREGTEGPLLTLRRDGGESICGRLECGSAFCWRGYMLFPLDGRPVRGWIVDLRGVFGRLTAGHYTLEILYPQGTYELFCGVAEAKPVDLRSPAVPFSVGEVALEQAEAANHTDGAVRLVVDDASSGPSAGPSDRGRITNNTDHSIVFSAYGSNAIVATEQPLFAPIITWQTWRPSQGWIRACCFGFCGNGLGSFELKAGHTQELRIPYLPDGIHRLVITCHPAGPRYAEAFDVYSKAFACNRKWHAIQAADRSNKLPPGAP